MTLKELRQRYDRLVAAGEAILKTAADEGWDDERRANFDTTHAELGEVREQIDAMERMREARAAQAERFGERLDNAETAEEQRHAERQHPESELSMTSLAFKYLRSGWDEFSPEERAAYQMELRQQGTTPDSAGGFTVGEEWMRMIEDAMKLFTPGREVFTVLRTAGGEPLHFPTSDGTAELGEIIAENAVHNDNDLTFAEKVYGSFQYSSGIVKSSKILLQDSYVQDLAGFFAKRIGERIGRIQAQHFTVGVGTTEPEGIVPGSTLGHTAAGASIVTDDLISLMHSVDPAYANAPSARWCMNWETLGAIRSSLSDADGFPIWAPVPDEAPGRLLGRPITILQSMAGIATTAIPVIYGDVSKYIIRDAGGLSIFRSDERFFESQQVAWLGTLRSDGGLLDAGGAPVKHMAMP